VTLRERLDRLEMCLAQHRVPIQFEISKGRVMASLSFGMRRYSVWEAGEIAERVKAAAREFYKRYGSEPNVYSVNPKLAAPEIIGPMRLLPDGQMQICDIDIGIEVRVSDVLTADEARLMRYLEAQEAQ